MQEINSLFGGFAVAFTWFNVMLMLAGVTLGVLIGVLPGLGGANGVADLAGNHLANDHTWSFTTGAGATCPCSLWPGSSQPAVAASGDGNAVELGGATDEARQRAPDGGPRGRPRQQ